MKNIIWFFALLLLLILQAGILLPFHISSVSLMVIVVALSAVLSDFNQGLTITLMGGLLLDFVSGFPDGIFSMSLLIAFLILHFILSEVLAKEPNRIILVVTVLGSTLLYFLSLTLVSYIFSWFGLVSGIDFGYWFSSKLPFALLWNLFFTYPVFIFYIWVQNLISKFSTNEEPIRT